MNFTRQATYDVRFEWGPKALTSVAAASDVGVAIVVDVLSFSTCVDIACGRGALVLPCRWKDSQAEAFALARGALLASRRSEPGLSLSPQSLLAVAAGLKLVLPSPNGSSLSLACGSPVVLAGCLRNASAVAAFAASQPCAVSVIACGEQWPDGSLRPAIEDLLGAGAIIHALPGTKSPEARLAEAAFEAMRNELAAVLAGCASGVELTERGFAADSALAAAHDCSDCVPRLIDDAYTNQTANPTASRSTP